MNSRIYEIGRSKIALLFGDITTSKAEVLVSSDDSMLSMGGGVSAAIRRIGGPQVAADASKMTPAHVGSVIVSSAGDLPAKYIFHAITLGLKPVNLPLSAIVRQTTQHVMDLLQRLGCTSVAFPAIGGGAARIPYEIIATEMAGVLVGTLLDTQESYTVELYLMDRFGQMNRDDFFVFFEAFAAQKFGLSTSPDASNRSFMLPGVTSSAMDSIQIAEAERRHQIYMMLRHLDARRNQIESDLLQILTRQEMSGDIDLPQAREQLNEIQALRHSYEAELAFITDKGEKTVVHNSVFVISTSNDLKPHRQAVRDVINSLRLKFIGMEEFTPTVQAPTDLIRRKVNESQVYLGILGLRYGYVDPSTGLSMTELEYRQAIASNKRICLFVMDQSAPILVNMVEDDPIRFAKLVDFRGRILKAHTCAMFTNPADLAQKAEATLREPWPS